VAITTIPGATSSDLTTLKGTELADTFTIEGSNQFIEGLAGADIISAASGIEAFTVDAGADNDNVTLAGEASSVLLDLKGGNDLVTLADSLNSTIAGGSGSDTVTQTANRTYRGGEIFGRSGNDQFTLVNAIDTSIRGDQDDDTIVSTGTITNTTIRGGNQRDTITLAGAGGIVKGDNNEDTITVTGTATGLYVGGDGAADVINISSGSVSGATVRGGNGADDINITSAALLVKGDKGNDDIDQTGVTTAKHTIFGGAGNDAIDATSTGTLLIMGDQAEENATADGNDTINVSNIAASGAHTIMGGAGKDTITTNGGNGDERIDAGSGDDQINGGAGQDTILGRAGKDTINITAANTAGTNRLVQAGADDDKITFDAAAFAALSINDTYAGENGTDTIAVIGAAANFDMTAVGTREATAFDNVTAETFALGSTSAIELALGAAVSYTFSAQAQTSGFRTFDATHTNGGGVARILTMSAAAYSSAAGVTLSGSANGDVVSSLTGGSGADTLNDGAVSTAAGDTLVGGAGIDTFNVTATTTNTQISDLGAGAVSDIFTVGATANGADITVTGNYVATTATSNNLSLAGVTLTGQNGVDINMSAATGNFGFTIDGGNTAATLMGSAKADAITGAGGNDSLVGNSGNDTITPAAGNDTIVAGVGDDSIVFTLSNLTALDSIDGGTGTDTVTVAAGGNTATVDFDRVSNLLAIVGTADAGVTNVTFDAITETTAQTVSLTSNGNAGGENLVVLNNAASATTTFNITGATGADNLVGSNGADTLSGAAGADTINGGAGADIISAGAGGTNDVIGGDGADRMTLGTAGTAEQVFFTATTKALAATEAGTTAGTDIDFVTGTRGDTVTTYVSAEDTIDFKDALLTNATGTETAVLNTIAAGGTVVNTNQFVEITTALADGTMGSAITQLNGLTTTAVAIGDSFMAFQNDGTNGYLYLVDQVSAANTIAAQDVTLIAQIAGVTNIANGDLTTIS
jgi:Ca2+-binding RTX toxin-like protein